MLMLCNPPVSVYKSVEGESISPAGGEILNVDLRVPDVDKKETPSDYTLDKAQRKNKILSL